MRSDVGSFKWKSFTVFNTMNPNFNAVVKWPNLTGWLSREAESLTLDNRLTSLRVDPKILESVCSPALIVVLCSAIPASKDLAVAEQLEEILGIRRVRILDRIVKPDLRARISWNIARGDRVVLRSRCRAVDAEWIS